MDQSESSIAGSCSHRKIASKGFLPIHAPLARQKDCVNAVVKEFQSSSGLALEADHQRCARTGKDRQTQPPNYPKESGGTKSSSHVWD